MRSPGAADYEAALSLALSKLKARDRFEEELRQTLDVCGFLPETITKVLSFLKDRRYVDDRRTIESHIARRSGRRAVGEERIRAELLARGAPEELIERCLSETPRDEVEDAVSALRSKSGRLGDRLRAARFLASRGFSEDAIESALNRFFDPGDA